jgi:sulfonate transport system ATP-binding protein
MSDERPGAVRAERLSVAFGDNVVLRDIDLHIAPGEFVALLGRSGSGKTTLLRVLAGLHERTAGNLHVPQARSVVFQEARLLPWKRVDENVAVGLRAPDRRERAAAALHEVGLDHRRDAWPATLSGGEAQRVGLARAIVRDPQFLLLDEPFASIDALTRLRMYELVIGLWRRHGPAVLLVTHDVDEALLLADRVLVLDGGQIATDLRVDLDRPRDAADPRFARQRRTILAQLGVAPTAPALRDHGAPVDAPHSLATGVLQ